MTIQNGVLLPSGVIQLRGGTFEAMSQANPLLARREIAGKALDATKGKDLNDRVAVLEGITGIDCGEISNN